MKVPLLILERRIQIVSIFSCPRIRVHGQIKFIVDTGSPLTILSEGDALRLHIPLNSLRDVPDEKKHIYMGGSVSELKLIPKEVKLGFRNDKNEMEYITLPNFCVAVGTKKDEKYKQISQGSPSILGLDFFEQQKFLLHIDTSKNNMFFENS